jgi:hypothetical protein
MFGVADESALGDLKDETVEGKVGLTGCSEDVFWKREVCELSEGNVDGEGEVVGDVFGGCEDCAEELSCEKSVEAGLFGERNELVGEDEAALRMMPARESFEATQEASAELYKRLKIRYDLVGFEGSAEIDCVVRGHGRDDTTGWWKLHREISATPALDEVLAASGQ